MNAKSQVPLEMFWSWTGGILAVLLIGVLAPVALSIFLGAIPLMRARSDYRIVPTFAVIAAAFVAAGALVLACSPHRGPAVDFWLVLALQIGVVALMTSTGWFLELSIRRARQERAQIESLSAAAS